MRLPTALSVFLISITVGSALGQSPPAQGPAVAPPSDPAAVSSPAAVPVTYEGMVARLIKAREARAAVIAEMQKKLHELSQSGGDPRALDGAKTDLLIRRRMADVETERALRAVELHWFELSLTPEQTREYAGMNQPDREALLDTRSVVQRLGVPLPPANFSAAPIENIFAYVQQESGVRVVVDWPALGEKEIKVERRTPISLEIGRYNRPAIETLRSALELLSGGKAKVDLSRPGAAVITTDAGLKQSAELNQKFIVQVMEARAWESMDIPLEPLNLAHVPLEDALFAGMPPGEHPPLFVDWRGLAEAGITRKTPVDLRLGVHTIGQRLAVLADAVADRPEVRKMRGIRFDLHPSGEILLSTTIGFGRVTDNVNRVQAAAATPDARDAIAGRLPEVPLDHATLADSFALLADATKFDIRADWQSLAACGLSPRSAVDVHLYNVPLLDALGILADVPEGRPPVEWEIADGKIIAHGPRR